MDDEHAGQNESPAVDKQPDATQSPLEPGPLAVVLEPDCTLASPTFFGFLGTQFLGAFNDNYFKQMVLLTCISLAAAGQSDRQPLAMAAFALPFVLLSGYGGFLSDRYSKRTVIVLCKVAEIVIMGLALVVLALPGLSPQTQLLLLIAVLFLMGGQSALFGPSKYGVLPELFQQKSLLPVNGAVQMTTFLAIIFGMVCAGLARDQLRGSLWLGSLIAVAIAAVGTAMSLLIRRTVAAQREIRLEAENLHIPRDIRRLFRDQPLIFRAAMVASAFWFLGGVTQPAVNTLGDRILQFNAQRTSMLTAGIGVGVAIGCVVAGFTGRIVSSAKWTRFGAWGIVGSLLLIGFLERGTFGLPAQRKLPDSSLWESLSAAEPREWLFRVAMVLLGFAAGVFVVPVQVFLQSSPPGDQKGRLLGSVNLLSWIAILMAAAYLAIANQLIVWSTGNADSRFGQSVLFVSLALLMLPIAIWYRLPGGPAQPLSNHDGV